MQFLHKTEIASSRYDFVSVLKEIFCFEQFFTKKFLNKWYNFLCAVDGTTNFAHGYPSFAVSVGVLFQGNPAAAAVVCIL